MNREEYADWLEDDVGVIYWSEEFKTWCLFIKDVDGNQYTEAEYFPYKREAIKRSDDFKIRIWEIGKRSGEFCLIQKP